ncbi:MAG: non-heme iron oxygenase ferredoxin subunit [Candidatus Tectomicrobia bacterium]|nr:non-heme iron oxygenase ferredoxin subunit [Candidatus Tectomicrobia bacterium]
MGTWITVATTAEVFEGQMRPMKIQGQCLVLVQIKGRYYALEDVCTHGGGPLSEGKIRGEEVTCPWHRSRFKIATGEVVEFPAYENLSSYPVQVKGDEIQVELPIGLCGTCPQTKWIRKSTGILQLYCRFSDINPSYLPYPRLPQRICEGYYFTCPN